MTPLKVHKKGLKQCFGTKKHLFFAHTKKIDHEMLTVRVGGWSVWGGAPRSRPCSLEEQYFKCGIFRDYDAPQRRVSDSEAPVLAGGIPVFLRGSQFSGASESKEGAGEQI